MIDSSKFPPLTFHLSVFPMKASINSSKFYSSKFRYLSNFVTLFHRQSFALYGSSPQPLSVVQVHCKTPVLSYHFSIAITGICRLHTVYSDFLSHRGYAQGVVQHRHINFWDIYHVLLWHEWTRAGALYGDFTLDALLIFHFPICILVQ